MSRLRIGWLGRGSPLGRQLLASIMLFSAVVSCIATAVQLFTDYQRDVQALEDRLEEIHTSYAPGIEESIWLLDEAQLQVQLEGITTLPGIAFARVDSAIGTHYLAGSTPGAKRELTRSIPLFRGNMYLGLLQVGASLEDIYVRLQSRVLIILMTQAVKTFLVALFALFIFHQLVTRHLATMAAYARGLHVERLDIPLKLERRPPKENSRDELDDVSAAFNEMRESLQCELHERQRAERASFFLSEAGAVLMESLDQEKILPRIAALSVQTLADWCVIDLREGEKLHRVGGAHIDATKLPLLDELQRRYPPLPDSKALPATAMRTGKPVLVSHVSPTELRALCVDDAHFQLLLEIGLTSCLSVPLISRGQVLGAITLSLASPERSYGPADLELAQELARRAAIAIENARLYQQAERAIRLRDVFVSVAAHELRTPLLPLRLRLQSILRKSARAPSALDLDWLVRELTVAEHQTWRLGQLVDQLIDASSLSSGQPLELHRKQVDLCAVVEGVLDSMQQQIHASGSELIRKLQGPAVGDWDPRRLEQTVSQLVHNALKFGQRKPVEVSVVPGAKSVRLVVRDHGLGMPEGNMARLFERFSRGVSDRHYGGLGIGLYLVKHQVEAHGGTLSVESQPGEGSTFTVELPVSGAA
ncbi:ATP-binding protein [Archangium lansingense]|uniref:histidine kinase n=1 Tax=Archangium lansingense TaxID=2995310 RepID=A0ABT4APW6_9BACT|nr:ATP-binding protein [Archangium lansinium]MCY1083729.1 ATP-binding protein [Archangium lansinium]